MVRPVAMMWTVWVAALGSVIGSGVASAGPGAPCTYALSPPEVTGGTVSSTAVIAGCGAAAGPYSAVACIQPLENAAAIQCAQARDANPATVSVAHHPGVTYVATGRGCAAWIMQPPSPCQILGPLTAIL